MKSLLNSIRGSLWWLGTRQDLQTGPAPGRDLSGLDRLDPRDYGSLIAGVPGSLQRYQHEISVWCNHAFGDTQARDVVERRDRFLEEAVELYQATGGSVADAVDLVGYVYGRPVGKARQEIGGVMLTLCALAEAADWQVDQCTREELRRVWQNIAEIRIKHARKQRRGPLPGDYPDREAADNG